MPKNITLIGRRWFQKSYGNTYCTCTVIVDGKTVHKTPEEYGYGSYYEQAGLEWLDANGHITRNRHANGAYENTSNYMTRHGVTYHAEASDVSRERDL